MVFPWYCLIEDEDGTGLVHIESLVESFLDNVSSR